MSEQAIQDFVDFWRPALSLDQHPYVHPDDRSALEIHICRDQDAPSSNFEYTLAKGFKFRCPPGPVVGDLRSAKVIFCMLNPGFGFSDIYDYSRCEVRLANEASLRQDFDGVVYPFHCLNPNFMSTGGFSWWYRKLRLIIGRVADRRGFGLSDSLEWCSRRIASVELVAYHSTDFKINEKTLSDLESANRAKNLISNISSDKNKLFVVTRRVRDWGLPEEKNIIKYSPQDARHASFNINIDKIVEYLVN